MIFLVGSPRSGTTWLQRLLATHPAIRSGPESDIFLTYIGRAMRAFHGDHGRARQKGLACYHSEAQFMGVLSRYAMDLLQPLVADLKPGELFLEKTPGHALFISEILSVLPEARIIHLLRDPRDTVASILAAARSWGGLWAPRDVTAAGRMWRDHALAALRAGETLTAGQFLEVRYEELHRDSVGTLQRCADFLGIDWDGAAIAEAVKRNAPENLRAGGGTPLEARSGAPANGKPKDVEPAGFVRRAKVGSWRSDLTPWQKVRLWRVIRHALKQTGYQWEEFRALEPIADFLHRLASSLRKRLNGRESGRTAAQVKSAAPLASGNSQSG